VSRVLFLLILIVFNLYGYIDSDLDGVDDSIDRCPNTPFSDLVDKYGCSIKSLVKNKNSTKVKEVENIIKETVHKKKIQQQTRQKKVINHHILKKLQMKKYIPIKSQEESNHFDISLGFNKFGNYKSETLSANWYHKNISLSLSTTLDNSFKSSKLTNTRIWGYYNYRYNDSLLIKFGTGFTLPQENKRLDAGISSYISYNFDKINPYMGASINFTGIDNKEWWMKNSYSIYGGIGFYISNKLYISESYSISSSNYKYGDDTKSISSNFYYSIDKNWFTTGSYIHTVDGLDYKNGFSLSIGYYY